MYDGYCCIFVLHKEKPNDVVYPWQFDFILVDSSGNKLFPEPPPDFGIIPFDPKNSYWIDGTGKKHTIVLHGNDSMGLVFILAETLGRLKLDTNYVNNSFITLKIYLNPDSLPIHFKVVNPVNPVNTSRIGDCLIWNEDTLDYSLGTGTTEIVYP